VNNNCLLPWAVKDSEQITSDDREVIENYNDEITVPKIPSQQDDMFPQSGALEFRAGTSENQRHEKTSSNHFDIEQVKHCSPRNLRLIATSFVVVLIVIILVVALALKDPTPTPKPTATPSKVDSPAPTLTPTMTASGEGAYYSTADQVRIAWTAQAYDVSSGNGVFLSPDGNVLVVVSYDGSVRGFNPRDGAEKWKYSPDVLQDTSSFGGAFFSNYQGQPYVLYSLVTFAAIDDQPMR
jgi:hypothetical protein